MGGHGGLNILPQKRWHLYRDDNRRRVRQDEEEHKQEVEIRQDDDHTRVMADCMTLFKRQKRHDEAVGNAHLDRYRGNMLSSESGTNIQETISKEKIPNENTLRPLLLNVDNGDNFLSGVSEKQGRNNQDLTFHGTCPVKEKSDKKDSLGQTRNRGHINFFADLEEEITKKERERLKYLKESGFSTSLVSDFDTVTKKQNTQWYMNPLGLPSQRRFIEQNNFEKSLSRITNQKYRGIEGKTSKEAYEMNSGCSTGLATMDTSIEGKQVILKKVSEIATQIEKKRHMYGMCARNGNESTQYCRRSSELNSHYTSIFSRSESESSGSESGDRNYNDKGQLSVQNRKRGRSARINERKSEKKKHKKKQTMKEYTKRRKQMSEGSSNEESGIDTKKIRQKKKRSKKKKKSRKKKKQ